MNTMKETKFVVVGAGWSGVRSAIGIADYVENTLIRLKALLSGAHEVSQGLDKISENGNFLLNLARKKYGDDLQNIIEFINLFKVELWDSKDRPFQGISGTCGIRAHSGLHYPNSQATIENCKTALLDFTNNQDFSDLLVKTEAYYSLTISDFNGNPPKTTYEKFSKLADDLGAAEQIFDHAIGSKKYYQSPDKTIHISGEELQGLWKIDEPSVKLGEPLRLHIEKLLARKSRVKCFFNRTLQSFSEEQDGINLFYKNRNEEALLEEHCDYFINSTSFQGFAPKNNYLWKVVADIDFKIKSAKDIIEHNGFIYVKNKENVQNNKLFYKYQNGDLHEIELKNRENIKLLEDLENFVDAQIIEKIITHDLDGKFPKDCSPLFDARFIYQPSNNFVVRRKKTGKDPISFIVMDGMNPCIMPICNKDPSMQDDFEYYLLTHGAFTNLASSDTPKQAYDILNSICENESKQLYALTVRDVARYLPNFSEEFEYVKTSRTVLAKFVAKTEFRSSAVFGENKYDKILPQVIHVFPGKVTDDPSQQIINLLDISSGINLGMIQKDKLIIQAGTWVVKEDVMHVGAKEISIKMTEEEKQLCSGYQETIKNFRCGNLVRLRANSPAHSSYSSTDSSRKNSDVKDKDDDNNNVYGFFYHPKDENNHQKDEPTLKYYNKQI